MSLLFSPLNHRDQDYDVPFSMFFSKFDNGLNPDTFLPEPYLDLNRIITWSEVVDLLGAYAEQEFATKTEAPLFVPTYFTYSRGEDYATRSSLIVLDVDDDDVPVDKRVHWDDAAAGLRSHGTEAILYTSASNRDGYRFRIVIPISEMLTPEQHRRVVVSVCEMLRPGWRPDTTKLNCYSMFYTAGLYAGADNRYVHLEGEVHPPAYWCPDVYEPLREPPPRVDVALSRDASWGFEYVAEQTDAYLATPHDRHNAIMGLMTSAAMSARNWGYDLSVSELTSWTESIQRLNHGKHPRNRRNLERSAGDAIDFAASRLHDPIVQPVIDNGRLAYPRHPDTSLPWWERDLKVEIPADDATHDAPANDDDPAADIPTGDGVWDAGDAPDWIPPREWLMEDLLCRGYLTVENAAGGTGKTALWVARAHALATGRPITDERVYQRCRLLYVSLEDDKEEIERRFRACQRHHSITRDEVAGYLYVKNIRKGSKLARAVRNSYEEGKLAAELKEIIERRRVDVVLLDPFKKTHAVPENDNSMIDLVVDILTDIAVDMKVSVVALHHVAKGTADDAGNADMGRGASALKDGARITTTLTKMSAPDAKKLGVDEKDRWRMIRTDAAKFNLRPAAYAKWFKLVGVHLDNTTETYWEGDSVQTVEPWEAAIDVSSLVADEDLKEMVLDWIDKVQDDALLTHKGSANQSPRHVWHVFKRYNADITPQQAVMVINEWIVAGLVAETPFKDVNRNPRAGLRSLRACTAPVKPVFG